MRRLIIVLLLLVTTACASISLRESFVFNSSSMDVEDYLDIEPQAADSDFEENTEAPEITCDCDQHDLLIQANRTITAAVRDVQLRIRDPFMKSIAQIQQEKRTLLKYMEYRVIREVHRQHPALLEYTDFVTHLAKFMRKLGDIMEKKQSHSAIRLEVDEAANKFYNAILPDIFLCLSLGKCRTVPFAYHACLSEVSTNWRKFLGESPKKMIYDVAEAIYRWRKVEVTLIEMNHELVHAIHKMVTPQCVDEYARTLPCNCTISGVSQCWRSCPKAIETCFGKFSREWAARLFLVKNITGGYPKERIIDSFLKIRKSLMDAIQIFTEEKSPDYALKVTKICGTLGDMYIHPEQHNYTIRRIRYRTEKEDLTQKVQAYSTSWDHLGQQICNHAQQSNSNICWDGKKTIVIHEKTEDDLPPITKDVRPRPMIEWMEKKAMKKAEIEAKEEHDFSGNPLFDDEDSDDFGASGSGMPPIIETKPVIHVEKEPKKNIGFDEQGQPQGPSIVIDEKGQPSASGVRQFIGILSIVWIVII